MTTIWFTTESGRCVRYDAVISEDGKTATVGQHTFFTECWSIDRAVSMEMRAHQLIKQTGEWFAAIGRAEVVINRIAKAQHRIDVETEEGFTKNQDSLG